LKFKYNKIFRCHFPSNIRKMTIFISTPLFLALRFVPADDGFGGVLTDHSGRCHGVSADDPHHNRRFRDTQTFYLRPEHKTERPYRSRVERRTILVVSTRWYAMLPLTRKYRSSFLYRFSDGVFITLPAERAKSAMDPHIR